MIEATKGFRRLRVHNQLQILRSALAARQAKQEINSTLEQQTKTA